MLDAADICHVSSVHPRYDARIFYKMCLSSALLGYKTNLVVADGLGFEEKNNICIYDVGKESSRLKRMVFSTFKVCETSLKTNAKVYHLHDPELLIVALILKIKGKVVVFDSHEDVPKDILSKRYVPFPLRYAVSYVYQVVENFISSRLDAVVTPTDTISNRFKNINSYVETLKNYPLLTEFYNSDQYVRNQHKSKRIIIYIGSVTEDRGITELVSMMVDLPGVTLQIAGPVDGHYFTQLEGLAGWSSVEYLGVLNRNEVALHLAQADVGLLLLRPLENFKEALPVKLFEYMASGLPVVASNFPVWESIISSSRCGYCVDPLDLNAVINVIQSLLDDPDTSRALGLNGKKAVLEKYNWSNEEQKLSKFYRNLIARIKQ